MEKRMTKAAPTTAQAMSRHWNERADRFNGAASHVRHHDAWRHVFSTALGNRPLQVTDLGCGTGACALLLAELGHVVTAVDGSEGMLSHARQAAGLRRLDVNFVHSTMDEAELSDASADVVTLRNVLWTLENPAGALALAHRILRPGGTLLVSDGMWFTHRENNSAAEFGKRLPFFNGLTDIDVRAMLHEEGFGRVVSWKHLFDGHPYGAVYDDSSRMIEYFVLTATKPS
jgi:ubiquinone/menaquinone biosynthesis C-methylase UbiE